MATAYPTGLDNWGNPVPTTPLDDPTLGHAAAHSNLKGEWAGTAQIASVTVLTSGGANITNLRAWVFGRDT